MAHGETMSLCGLQHKPTGYYCTRELGHSGAHVAENLLGDKLDIWHRSQADISQTTARYDSEAQRQRGLRTIAKPGDPDYKP